MSAQAKHDAWLAAKESAGGDAPTAVAILNEAEMDVMRALLSRTLGDGEAAYWRLVEEKIRSDE